MKTFSTQIASENNNYFNKWSIFDSLSFTRGIETLYYFTLCFDEPVVKVDI